MQLNVHTPAGGAAGPCTGPARRPARIQQRLAVAGAELELTNSVLDRSLPDSVKRSGDVQRPCRRTA